MVLEFGVGLGFETGLAAVSGSESVEQLAIVSTEVAKKKLDLRSSYSTF